MIPAEFDDIRPFTPEEMPAAIDCLLSDPQFTAIVSSFYKDVPLEMLRRQAHACKDNLEFQKTFFYPLVGAILARHSDGCTIDTSALPDKTQSYTFVSNHRDIVLDAALLSAKLVDEGFPDTPEIALGDNLLVYPWIRTLVRLNKSFIVKRSVGMREMLRSSQVMSSYMHYVVSQKHSCIWIAQREGRAKDSDDRTQESLLKMMAMGGEGTPLERLDALNIVPLTISYEYDPCDFLKAKEFQQKRDDPHFKKSPEDDLRNMQTGIFGYKGRIHYQMAAPVNGWLDELRDEPKGKIFVALAARMDRAIHRGYRIYPNNYVALDLLEGGTRFADRYTPEQKARFEQYLRERIDLVDLPDKDEAFLRERLLTMYANPLRNHLAAQA